MERAIGRKSEVKLGSWIWIIKKIGWWRRQAKPSLGDTMAPHLIRSFFTMHFGLFFNVRFKRKSQKTIYFLFILFLLQHCCVLQSPSARNDCSRRDVFILGWFILWVFDLGASTDVLLLTLMFEHGGICKKSLWVVVACFYFAV